MTLLEFWRAAAKIEPNFVQVKAEMGWQGIPTFTAYSSKQAKWLDGHSPEAVIALMAGSTREEVMNDINLAESPEPRDSGVSPVPEIDTFETPFGEMLDGGIEDDFLGGDYTPGDPDN